MTALLSKLVVGTPEEPELDTGTSVGIFERTTKQPVEDTPTELVEGTIVGLGTGVSLELVTEEVVGGVAEDVAVDTSAEHPALVGFFELSTLSSDELPSAVAKYPCNLLRDDLSTRRLFATGSISRFVGGT